MADWLDRTAMALRGEASGRVLAEHRLDEAAQGPLRPVVSAQVPPVLRVRPGARVTVETPDAFQGRIRSEDDRPSEALRGAIVNPQCGPIRVEGARPGDALAVLIERIVPRGPQPRGVVALIEGFGALVPTADTAMLSPGLPERVRLLDVTEEGIRWSDAVTLPYEPFLGSIGTAPALEALSTLLPDRHGGNMDLPDVGPGRVIYLPVLADGAMLHLGDGHAAQGDGELCGVAVEHATTTTLRIDLIRGWRIDGPLIEAPDLVMAVGSAKPLEDAARIASRALIGWMAEGWGWDPLEAYMLLGQAGRLRVGNLVDPKYTVGASAPRWLVEAGRAR